MRIQYQILICFLLYSYTTISAQQRVEIQGGLSIDQIDTSRSSTQIVVIEADGKIASADIIGLQVRSHVNHFGIQEALFNGFSPKEIYDAGYDYYQILGKQYKGSQIFYIDSSNVFPDFDAIGAAPYDSIKSLSWGCNGVDFPIEPNRSGLGDGKFNTLNGCMDSGSAAKFCLDFEHEGNTEWYFPSLDEAEILREVFRNFEDFTLGGTHGHILTSGSAPEFGSLFARTTLTNGHNVASRAPGQFDGHSSLPVRPISYFKDGPESAPISTEEYGGLVFYLADPPADLNGDGILDDGLVMASSDQGLSASFGCEGSGISGLSADIGTGAVNTQLILASCSENDIAAWKCADLILNGCEDWYLPSREELQLAMSVFGDIDNDDAHFGLEDINNQGAFFSKPYISSTQGEIDSSFIILPSMISSDTAFGGKAESFQIRLIRAFRYDE